MARSLLQTVKIDVNLAKSKSNETPLYAAAHQHNTAIVEMLLQSDDIEINKGDENGQTPLHVAAYKGWDLSCYVDE